MKVKKTKPKDLAMFVENRDTMPKIVDIGNNKQRKDK